MPLESCFRLKLLRNLAVAMQSAGGFAWILFVRMTPILFEERRLREGKSDGLLWTELTQRKIYGLLCTLTTLFSRHVLFVTAIEFVCFMLNNYWLGYIRESERDGNKMSV